MDIGKLRHRITLLKPFDGDENNVGEEDIDYREYKSVRAYIAPMNGKEYAEAQKIRAETTYNIIIRYLSGVTTDMKIRYKEREFDIISILNIDERCEQLKIVASERDKNGC